MTETPQSGTSNLGVNIPLMQPLFFCTDLGDASYLPGQYTQDENRHLGPLGLEDVLTNSRKLQHVVLIRGEASGQTFEINFLKANSNWKGLSPFSLDKFVNDDQTLINKIIKFDGYDSTGAWINTDEGFTTTQASLGILNWNPPAVVAQSPGHFKKARFLIESPDRNQLISTLDFDLEIIDNDVPVPENYKQFYSSEFNRLLIHGNEIVQSGLKQQTYYNSLMVAIMQNNISAGNENIDQLVKSSQDKMNTTVQDGQNSVSQMVKSGEDGLTALQAKQSENDKKIDQQAKDIADQNIIKMTDAPTVIQKLVDDGTLNVGQSDADTDAKLSKINNELEGETK